MWIRYNPALKYYEYSNNNGGSWAQLPMSASSITEGTFGPGIVPPLPPNIAYTNVGNTFSIDQWITTGFYPSLILSNSSSPVDQKHWWMRHSGGDFVIQATNDVNSVILSTPLSLTRSGNVVAQNHILSQYASIRAQGARGSPPGSGGGIELFFQGGEGYLHCYDMAGSYPVLVLHGSNIRLQGGSTHIQGNLHNTAGYIYPGAVTASGGLQTQWYLAGHGTYGLYSNTGLYLAYGIWTAQHADFGTSCRTGTYFYEAGRPAHQGGWTDMYTPSYVDGQLTGQSGSMGYMYVGSTCFMHLKVSGSIAGSPTGNYFLIYYPPGITARYTYTAPMVVYANGSWELGQIHGSAGLNYGLLYRNLIAPWPAGATWLTGQWFFAMN